MFYSYKPFVITGPNGTVIHYRFNGTIPDGKENNYDPAVHVCKYQEREWIYVPDDINLGEQDEHIDFRKEEPDETALDEIKHICNKHYKAATRQQIEEQVGDTLDLLADVSKILETTTVCSAFAMCAIAGLIDKNDVRFNKYAQRAASVLGLIQNGALTIRGEYEDANDLIMKTMAKYSKVQQIVEQSYLAPLRAIGLQAPLPKE